MKPGATWPWIELAAVPRLKRLLESVSTVAPPQGLKLPETFRLYPKDQPILYGYARISTEDQNIFTLLHHADGESP